MIGSYFSIVRQTIQDLVPKAVMHLLVNFSRETVQNRLVANLYKETLFPTLLEEDEGLTNERKRVMALLDAYKEAFNGKRACGRSHPSETCSLITLLSCSLVGGHAEADSIDATSRSKPITPDLASSHVSHRASLYHLRWKFTT